MGTQRIGSLQVKQVSVGPGTHVVLFTMDSLVNNLGQEQFKEVPCLKLFTKECEYSELEARNQSLTWKVLLVTGL